MCAKTRRVKIEIAAKDVEKIESLLGKDPLVFEVDVEENKKTFSVLSQPEVINWEFVEEAEYESEKEDAPNPEIQSPVTGQGILISDTGDLVRLIEASWMVARLHPGIRYNTELYNYNRRLKYDELTAEEHRDAGLPVSERTLRAVSKMLLDVFYSNPLNTEEINEATLDTIIRIGEHFNEVKEADTLNKVMDILYRKDRL